MYISCAVVVHTIATWHIGLRQVKSARESVCVCLESGPWRVRPYVMAYEDDHRENCLKKQERSL